MKRGCRAARALADLVNRYTDLGADPIWLALFRVSFAAVGLCLAVSSIRLIPFTWGSRPELSELILVLHLLWAASAVALLIGVGGRVTVLVHASLAIGLLNFDDLGSTVNDDLYLMASFWILFVPLDGACALGRRPRRPRAWPLLLLGASDGVLLFTAGVNKLTDPFWRNGIGFYQVLSLPWIKPEGVSFVLDHRWLMRLFNDSAMLLELAWLPLFLWSRTRALACLLLALFFALMTFPLRIDYIGPLGLTHALALASVATMPWLGRLGVRRSRIRPFLHNILAKARMLCEEGATLLLWLRRSRIREDTAQPMRRALERTIAVTLTLYVAAQSAVSLLRPSLVPTLQFPPVSAGIAVPDGRAAPEPPLIEQVRIELRYWTSRLGGWLVYSSPWSRLNQLTCISDKALFGSEHLMGLYLYRLVLQIDDGARVEPIVVFLPDKTGGTETLGIGRPRHLQRFMYDVTALCQQALRAGPPPKPAVQLDGLLQLALARLSAAEREAVVEAELLVSPMLMSPGYAGDVKPWRSARWTVLFQWSASKPGWHFVQPPERHSHRLVPLH